jgi:ABC-type Fe3+-siderophore transport system permease subunit
MSSERSGGGLGAAFVLLIFVGAVAKFWGWIVVAFGAAVCFGLLLWLASYAARRVDDREEARKAIAGRADQQHAWVLADDERGTFGEYPPAV